MNTDLALIEDVDSRTTTTEDLRVVLVNGALGIPNSRNIFNHDDVVGMLALSNRDAFGSNCRSLIQKAVSINHVVDDAALADLFAPKLPLSRQVVAIIVAEMVVRSNRKRLDASVDEELSKDGLELGLTRLKVITTNEGLMTLSELDSSWNKGVLGSTVDEGLTFQDGRNCKKSGGGDLRVGEFDGSKEIVRSVVNTRNNVAVALGVGGPEDDDSLEFMVLLELPDVRADVLEVCGLVSTRNHIVSARLLVRGNEVGVVNGREGSTEQCHMGRDLAL